jgi:hypothetical protein
MPAPPKPQELQPNDPLHPSNQYGSPKFRKQADRLNREPLNQLALKFLKQLKVDLDPNLLYAHQLMLWALDSGRAGDWDDRVEGPVRAAIQSPPQGVWDALTKGHEHDPEADRLNPLTKGSEKNPAHLASDLLNQIQDRLMMSNRM